MLDLILAIVLSAVIAIFMRLSEQKKQQDIAMLAVNYLTCTILAATAVPWSSLPGEGLGLTAVMGLGNGVLYLTSFVLLKVNVRRNGVVLSSTFMKLGLLVTMLVSVLIYREIPTALQGIGFLLAVAAIVLLHYKKESGGSGFKAGLLALLFCGGMCDAMSKIFDETLGEAPAPLFLFVTFCTAMVLCVALMLRAKQFPGKRELLFGILIGVPNVLSTRCLLRALGTLPAVLVFPAFSVSTILVVTLAGTVLFREKLTGKQWAALVMILAALVLLNV